MTRDLSSGVSRRKFLLTSSAVGAAGLAGCTQNNDGGSSGGSGGSGGSDDSDDSDSTATGQPLSGTINIAGSSTVFPLSTALGEIFQEDNPEVNINVQSTGSGGGFANFFCVGDTDFNNASRPIKPEEEEQCSSNGVEPVELTVATDALTVIVNNDNDWATELTVDQLADLWSAETQPQQWSDVNSDWPDQDIELFGPSDASGTYDYFIESVLGEEGPGHRQDYSGTEQDRTIVQGVEGSEYAIGYLGFAYYTENSDRVQAVAIDDGDGPVEPSLETARTGEYTPLSRPLFTYPKVSALSEDHIAEYARFFVENTTNQDLVAGDVGYVPLTDDQQAEQMSTLEDAIERAND
ncbi:PstS family phosphate ABC transporter substrate-binding protein [Halosegnis rubeus]|jgi:phosphate transport system substrate-binding protein|uniref:Phosphate ABC transporter substrate-binding protein PstS family protein n=1 Tax=Halosegnis rubeus TaxID=2212850 RepID=A0A5N5UFY0_9EURY|nr:PstS family phosphate ABC transporter substrate-binding protein [Halosegnis rubeus]KAB7515394.1 phosphate ABC transporter substrate-binding protein PstS family protein [Halosegnis rubeus]KAB7517565.1 phosphate ABC transporter substrate-binding protein PstS family protein [Halosegnis rubeus]